MQEGLTDLLLCLADSSVITVRSYALNLLDLLPTDLHVLHDLRDALSSSSPAARLATLLSYTNLDGHPVVRPARFMYTLQVRKLCLGFHVRLYQEPDY